MNTAIAQAAALLENLSNEELLKFRDNCNRLSEDTSYRSLAKTALKRRVGGRVTNQRLNATQTGAAKLIAAEIQKRGL